MYENYNSPLERYLSHCVLNFGALYVTCIAAFFFSVVMLLSRRLVYGENEKIPML